MNRNDDLLNIALKTEQAGCRKDDTQCCGNGKKPTYEELEAQFKQLAAENAALKSANGVALKILNDEETIVTSLWASSIQEVEVETPATDAILASLRAEGVEMFASETEKLEWHESTTRFVRKFAAQLRSKSEVQS